MTTPTLSWPLTPDELRRLKAEGKTDFDIALMCRVSDKTVGNCRRQHGIGPIDAAAKRVGRSADATRAAVKRRCDWPKVDPNAPVLTARFDDDVPEPRRRTVRLPGPPPAASGSSCALGWP